MIITGLDLSLCATGLATFAGGTWDIRTITSPKGLAGMRRLDWLAREIGERIADSDLIVCEDIAFSRNGASHSEIVMLHGFIRRELWIDERPIALVAATTLKKFATGRGNAEKDQISKEVYRRWGIDTGNNNESDAVILAQIGRCLTGHLQPETKPQAEVIANLRNSYGLILKGVMAA